MKSYSKFLVVVLLTFIYLVFLQISFELMNKADTALNIIGYFILLILIYLPITELIKYLKTNKKTNENENKD